MSLKVRFEKLHVDAIKPFKSRKDDAGYDLYSIEDAELISGVPAKIKTGIAMEIPEGYVGLIWDRSGYGSKGIKVGGGVIDASYRGDITVCLTNTKFGNPIGEHINGFTVVKLQKGSKIAQILIQPVLDVDFEESMSLSETDRGTKGFGSSGV